MLDMIYPFARKQNKSLIYSWGRCLPKRVKYGLTYKEHCLLGRYLNLSPNIIMAPLQMLSSRFVHKTTPMGRSVPQLCRSSYEDKSDKEQAVPLFFKKAKGAQYPIGLTQNKRKDAL